MYTVTSKLFIIIGVPQQPIIGRQFLLTDCASFQILKSILTSQDFFFFILTRGVILYSCIVNWVLCVERVNQFELLIQILRRGLGGGDFFRRWPQVAQVMK